MSARRYRVKGRTFSKIAGHPASGGPDPVHIVEDGSFWQGDRSWEHRAVCGASITGVPVSRPKVTCRGCRKVIEDLLDK